MPFSRTVGMKLWECGYCGHLNRHRVNALHGWKVQCTNATCRRTFIVGEVFYETVPGFKVPPRDTVYSEKKWRSGQPVHKIVCANCAKVIQDEHGDSH